MTQLIQAAWSWGCVSAIDSSGPTIWIADASLVQVTAGRPLAVALGSCSQLPVFPAPKRIGLKSYIRQSGVLVKITLDYVIRQFHLIFGTAE
jgi:hypothetical protein